MLQDTAGGRILLCVICHYLYGKLTAQEPADLIINGFSVCERHSTCAICTDDFDEMIRLAEKLDATAPA